MLDPGALLEAVAEGFMALSSGAVEAPPRQAVPADGGSVLTMAGRRAGSPVAVKLVGVFPGNVELGLEPHPAVICLFDATTGRCLALMDGEAITGLRTAAGLRAVGARPGPRRRARARGGRLGRPGARAPADAAARAAVLRRAARRARSRGRRRGSASPPGTVEGADVDLPVHRRPRRRSCLDVAPGTHVTSVGFAPPGGELDPALAASSRLFVETRQAFAPPPAGCAELAGLDPSVGTELGEVLAGRAPGRTSPDEVTVYKAMGHIAEDAAAAELVYRAALSAGVGRDIDV